MAIKPNLTPEQGADLINFLNSISGMENARKLLPIYDAVMEAFRRFESDSRQQQGEGQS